MPPAAFARAGDVRHPVLTRSAVPANDPYLGDRPAIRLSRIDVARDMIAHLGLSVYAEGLYNLGSGRMVARFRYNLPARENPFGFKHRKTYGGTRRSEVEAWESLGKKVIPEIRLKTGYNVDDVNYCFCNVACSQFVEVHRIAGGATLMAHCARESECICSVT